ncbi:hypothetical protein TNCV_2626851 [Trichonephila clavipes]|uniref:Uncharacterized protein n=1 Tax=Trichonephila clavipes TaxID=2585209 RepID=A0A8X6W7F2_TRICX|nr:hypothetical protein TNCV_2626851 [Trichonephila clavipes]
MCTVQSADNANKRPRHVSNSTPYHHARWWASMAMMNARCQCAFTMMPPIHGCNHLDAVNRTWVNLKKKRSHHSCARLVVDHTIEEVPVCDAASRVAAAMVSNLRVHAAADVVQTLVVLQTTLILDSGLVTCCMIH